MSDSTNPQTETQDPSIEEYELFDPATVTLAIYDHEQDFNLAEDGVPGEISEAIDDTLDRVVDKEYRGGDAEAQYREALEHLADAMSDTQTSLYMNVEGKFELPVYTSDRTGTWHSMVGEYGNAPENPPTEYFFNALSELPNNDESGWGNVTSETWEGMTEAEQGIIVSARESLVMGHPSPELAFLMKYADEIKTHQLE